MEKYSDIHEHSQHISIFCLSKNVFFKVLCIFPKKEFQCNDAIYIVTFHWKAEKKRDYWQIENVVIQSCSFATYFHNS